MKRQFYEHFSIIMSSNSRYQPFVAAYGKLGGIVLVVDDNLSSHKQEVCPITSLDKNCKEVKFRTDWNYYVDLTQTYLALKLKICQMLWLRILQYQRSKKEHTQTAKTDEEQRRKKKWLQFLSLLMFTTISTHFVPMLRCTSTISKVTTLMDFMRTRFTFPTISSEPSLNTGDFFAARGTTLKKFLMLTKSVHPIKFFTQYSISSECYFNEKNTALTRSYTENPFWYQQFDLQQISRLRRRQPIYDFDAADICRLYVTTMRIMNFQDDIPLIPIDDFKDHYVLVFDLTSMQDATEKCHYPEQIGEPLRRELNFTFPLRHVTELIVLGERKSSVAVDKFGVVGKNI